MKNFTNFNLHLYTDILFGKDTEKETGRMIRKHGGKRVMVVYGMGSVRKSGLFDRVIGTLKAEGLSFVEFGGVQPNPRRSLVEKGVALAHEEKADFFLALGGGSAIDTAKAIALAVANGGEYWKFFNGVPAQKMAPVGTVHTISAAGSETSRSTVLVDDIGTGHKRGLNLDCCRPVFAIMNPELTYSVSAYQTGAGAADIVAHTVARYFIKDTPLSALGDEFAEGLVRTVVKYAPIAIANPNDYEARAELMMAAWCSHSDLTGMGRDGPRGGEHALEHQLSGHYDTAHGAGLAAVMPAWLQYVAENGTPEQAARVARFCDKVFVSKVIVHNIKKPHITDYMPSAGAGIRIFHDWLESIMRMPLTLEGLGIPKEDVPAMVKRTVDANNGKITGFMDLDEKAIGAIYTSMIGGK